MSEPLDLSASITRRGWLGGSLTALAAAAVSGTVAAAQDAELYKITKGRLKQGVCQWSAGLPLDQLCKVAQALGLGGIDLVNPNDWPLLKQHGLVCSMANSHSIGKGFNRTANHAECAAAVRRGIDACAEAGFPNVICFSGNRAGMADEEGLRNCAEGLKPVVAYAEEKKVTVCMELLNSRRDHHDYMCDRSEWGMKLVDLLGSERFRLLFDIYHMQIDEGDVIASIKAHGKKYFGHYHTAGVPGRHDLDEEQELYYPAIAKAVVESGHTGFFSHEFMAKGKDKAKALADAVKQCDV